MKSFILGLLTVLLLGLAGFAVFRGSKTMITRLFSSPSPSALPSTSPTPTLSPTPKPSSTPAPTYRPTTKGGLVKGVTTTTTTTTTSRLLLTLIKTNECKTYTTEVKDITGPLTLKYSIKDGYLAAVTAWKSNGEEVISQREIAGSGELKKIEGLTYLKIQTQPAQCESTSDTWLTLTAER